MERPPPARGLHDLAEASGSSPWRIAGRVALLVLGGVALYGLAPRLVDVWSQVPQLGSVSWPWILVMVAAEAGSLACLWVLTRIALPQVSLFVAGTSQLAANAVAKIVPGGGAIGAALSYRMLAASGVARASAASALAATGLVSAWVLFSLPAMALLVSLVSSPVPNSMANVAWGGALVFAVMFGVGILVVRTDRPLVLLGQALERVGRWVATRRHRENGLTSASLLAQRDEMVDALGARLPSALAAAVGNWMLDYFALVAALQGVGSSPRLSLVLLAYAVSAVLAMIPITPGGLGFVEAGLAAMLTLAGVPSSEALLATLAYRIVSYWLPLPAGAVAYGLFRRRYGRPTPISTDLA